MNGKVITNLKAKNFVLWADKNQMTNAFSNIIDNSIKYYNNNPEITIETFNSNNYIEICFTDNGIGIDNKNFTKIFVKI